MKNKYLEEMESCQIIKIFSLLGKKWSLPILHSFIEDDKQTYSHIQKKFLKYIHPTILSNRLKSFEKNNIIIRVEDGYIISDFGKELIETIHEFKHKAINVGLFIPNTCKENDCICNTFFNK